MVGKENKPRGPVAGGDSVSLYTEIIACNGADRGCQDLDLVLSIWELVHHKKWVCIDGLWCPVFKIHCWRDSRLELHSSSQPKKKKNFPQNPESQLPFSFSSSSFLSSSWRTGASSLRNFSTVAFTSFSKKSEKRPKTIAKRE